MHRYLHIIDDEPELVWTLEQHFRRRDYQVVSSHNGREALDNLKKHPPALIILDIVMPGMSGLKVCEHMRRLSKLADTPVIFLSGRSDLTDRLKGFGAGCDDYMTKPFDLQELEARVEALLRRCSRRKGPAKPHRPERKGWLLAENKRVPLTPSEMSLMTYFMDRANQLITSQELLQRALNYPPGTGNLATVRVHIGNLRSKIKSAHLDSIRIKTIDRCGYMLVVEVDGRDQPAVLQ